MSPRKGSSADPVRRMALLWGPQNNPGRSGLTVKAIVEAAIAIADADGLEALSMRHVAERLGVGAMSLYTHIPSKAELIDLMIDTAYGQLYAGVDEPSQQPGDWRDALRFIARRNWELYIAHPWMLEANNGRPVLGPHASLKYEAELRPLNNLGLSDLDMDTILTLVITLTEGCARAQIAIDRTQRETGMTGAEWWATQAPLLEKVVDPKLFPVATRVGMAAGKAHQASEHPMHALNFGLERILAGITELIPAKNSR